MTVEVIENFDGYQDLVELKGMYSTGGLGLTGEVGATIRPTTGLTTMPGAPQAPRNPPSCLFFTGKSSATGGPHVRWTVYDEDEPYQQVASGYKTVGFNFRPIAGEQNGSGGDTWDVILKIWGNLGVTSAISLRVNHSLELFDPPDNGYPGGGIGLDIYKNETGGSSDRLFQSLSDMDEETANEAGLYWAAGNQNGAFFEYYKWYYVEFRIYMNGGSSTVELRVNGVTIYKNDTVSLSYNAPVQAIQFRSGEDSGAYFEGSGFSYEITDVVVQDWSTGFTGWIFPAVVDTVKVTTEVVGEIDFTPQTGTDNAAMVDEVPHDYDTTYNESTTATHKDRFSTTQQVPYTVNNGPVYAIKAQAILKDTLAVGTRTARVVAFENVTEGVGPTTTLDNGSNYSVVWGVFPTNPDTSALWTKAEVNGSEIGYEIIS